MNTHYQKYKEQYIRRSREWREKYPERVIENGIKYRHGISLEDYKRILEEQNGKCAICGKLQSDFKQRFIVDHCHKTEKIRGLLCYRCNTLLGRIENVPNNFKKLLEYLEKYK